MEDIDHVFSEEDYRSLTNYKAFSQFVRYGTICQALEVAADFVCSAFSVEYGKEKVLFIQKQV